MKSLALLPVALAAALPPPELTKSTVPGLKVVPLPLRGKLFDSNGKLQSVLSNPEGAVLPKSSVQEVQIEKPKVFANVTGMVRKKVRYGPYRLPPVSEENWQRKAMGLAGMADEYHYNVTKPCVSCSIAALSADLEYADGTVVPSSSAWLHHSALVVQGSKIFDPVCGESNTETPFSSGNERSTMRFYQPTSPIKTGYRIHADDTMTIVGEYKSEVDKEQYVWLALSYELVEEEQAKDFKDAHVIWMSTIGSLNCARDKDLKNPFGESNLTAQGVPKVNAFTEHSLPWTSPISGTILGMGGHVHDGATAMELFKDGERLCESKVYYSKGATGGMGSNHAGGEHVSGMSACRMARPFKKDDKFWLSATYDFTQHEGSKTEDGNWDEIMGVGTVLVIT